MGGPVTKLQQDTSGDSYVETGPIKRDCSSPWSPSFVKISTNDPMTGIGNGVYYVKPRGDLKVGTYGIKGEGDKLVDNTEDLKAKPADPSTASGLPENNSFNAVLTKCVAQTCEEEMDTKFGMMDMKDEFGM